MNARDELKEILGALEIKCARIKYEPDYEEVNDRSFLLKEGHTKGDLDTFYKSIDFDYGSGYGGQELYGTVWLKDGTWLERGEYDGSEWWEHRFLPQIPDQLKDQS